MPKNPLYVDKVVLKDGGVIETAAGTAIVEVSPVGAVTLTGTETIVTAEIADSAITLAKLATGVTPSHIVKFAGTHAYAGGGTSDAATITGVAATDIVMATMKASTNAVAINLAVPTTNTVTFHFTADPGAATEVFYTVFSAAA
jgi:hypothetical protein